MRWPQRPINDFPQSLESACVAFVNMTNCVRTLKMRAQLSALGGVRLGSLSCFVLTLVFSTVTVILPAQILQTVVSFRGTNGANPYYGVTLGPDGNFYGTTSGGGDYNDGTIFRLSPQGLLTTLVSFNGTNGHYPTGALTLGLDGNLYGTTSEGGTNGNGNGWGTVFRMTLNGELTTLASFNFTNGQGPQAGLTLGSDGNFYGTTIFGGFTNANYSLGMGTVFRATSNGVLTALVCFGGTNGSNPQNGLTLGADGNFYGSTSAGYGTEFRVTTNGILTPLYSFSNNADGSDPQGNLTVGPGGNLYGTTSGGNGGSYGTVFMLTTNRLNTLASFGATNGNYPVCTLALAANGKFYGTTYYDLTNGYGTVFQITTNGGLATLLYFTGTDGSNPSGVLTLGPDGNIYGTTRYGGSGGDGTVFSLSTAPVLKLQWNTNSPLLSLYGFAGRHYTVQYVNGLPATKWVDLFSVSNLVSNPFLYLDSSGQAKRFYRAVDLSP
jgi:uncharacterized repeat protein (TIGR03803 family)